MNKRDLYREKNGLLLLLRIDSVTEMILMLYASLCMCVCVRTSVRTQVRVLFCVFALECFADQMHLLLNSASQQAALTKYKHALAHARLHNLRCKHSKGEMNM